MPPTVAFPFVSLLLFSGFSLLFAQQAYPPTEYTMDCLKHHPQNAGYLCESSMLECQTLAYFRTTALFSSLSSIAGVLFNATPLAIAASSSLPPSTNALDPDQGLFIPIDCRCYGQHSSSNFTYTIRPGNTLVNLANVTYEGLTTCQAMQDANPAAVPTDLKVGQQLIFPLRCACPSKAQQLEGIQMLVTYPVGDWENVATVTHKFNVSVRDFLVANSLPNATMKLFPAVTVLLPFSTKPTTPPNTSMITYSSGNSSSSGKSSAGMYAGIAVAVLVVLTLTACSVTFFAKRKKRRNELGPYPLPASSPVQEKLPKDLFEGMSAFANEGKVATYAYDEIRQATKYFSPSMKIQGTVYRGRIKGRAVAIKVITRNVMKEVQILRTVHHANLVELLGVCIASPDESYLVYEYAENGSLSDWLHDIDITISSGSSSVATLSWNNRLQIALDVATALEYIHDHTNPSLVHKDIKSSNILLDAKLRGKVANFGLAKSAEDNTGITRHIIGTQGYMAPEYAVHGIVNPKVDVFSFGVVLLEMLSGDKAVMKDKVGKERSLAEAIGAVLEGDGMAAKHRLKMWMDPRLQMAFPLDCAYSVALLAGACVCHDPAMRPSAGDVAFTLAKQLEISLEWEPSAVLDYENPLQAR